MAITIETNFTPPITIDEGALTTDGGGGLLSFLQPTIRGDVLGVPVQLAPYGEASGLGTVVFFGAIALLLMGAFAVYRRR